MILGGLPLLYWSDILLTSLNPPAPKINDWLLIAGIAVAVAVIGAAIYPFIAKRRKAHYESTKSVKT